MKYKFTCRIWNYPFLADNCLPILKINLFNQTNKDAFPHEALIDSGADCCIINSSFAEQLLNVDYKTGVPTYMKGIAGTLPTKIYMHDLLFEIPSIPNSRTIIPFGFMDSPTIDVVLGRYIFFDKFRITFEQSKFIFSVQMVKQD